MNDHKTRAVLYSIALGALLSVAPGCAADDLDPETAAEEADETVAEATSAVYWSANGHSYWFHPEPATWPTAKLNCESKGYYLATVNGSNEQLWLHQQISGYGGWWWIGYNDRGFETVWEWTKGTSQYTNWGAGEPDNYSNQDCALIKSGDGYWYDMECSGTKKYVCERNN